MKKKMFLMALLISSSLVQESKSVSKCTDINTYYYSYYLNHSLRRAASYYYIDGMSRLIDKGAKVNGINDEGLTPLMSAVYGSYNIHEKGQGKDAKANVAAVNFLLSKGANINSQMFGGTTSEGDSTNGYTALTWALRRMKFDVAKTLLEHGAKVSKTDINIAMHKPDNTEIVDLLNKARAKQKYKTPLMLAVIKGNTNEVNSLLKEDLSSLNAKTTDDKSALTFAIMKRNSKLVRLLLEHGAKINEEIDWNMSIKAEDADIYELLDEHYKQATK